MKRTRLSPEARKEQLLDAARASILKTGLPQFSLKKLALEAGVSEPLLFHYFASRTELLQQLLHRDFNRTIDALNKALDGAKNLDEILRIYVTRNFEQHAEESIIDTLLSDPDIASVVEERRSRNAREREKILIDRISAELGIKRQKAVLVALMASAASVSAARHVQSTTMKPEDAIETVIQFVTQGFESQRNA